MPFPNIDPVIFQLGPLVLRWYALAYMVALIGGWYYIAWLMRQARLWQNGVAIWDDKFDGLLTWLTIGVILGGRLGYVLFYNVDYYIAHPEYILAVWRGGMSFHGGWLGVAVAVILFSRRHNVSVLTLGDSISVAAPIGLFFGRLANFINSELWGRVTDAPFGVIFPNAGAHPRHPSQLYEAALEGVVLFIILLVVTHCFSGLKKPGLCTGLFLAGYGISRMIVEQFREPDAHIGFLVGGTTMGFWLSAPMILIGCGLIFRAFKKG